MCVCLSFSHTSSATYAMYVCIHMNIYMAYIYTYTQVHTHTHTHTHKDTHTRHIPHTIHIPAQPRWYGRKAAPAPHYTDFPAHTLTKNPTQPPSSRCHTRPDPQDPDQRAPCTHTYSHSATASDLAETRPYPAPRDSPTHRASGSIHWVQVHLLRYAWGGGGLCVSVKRTLFIWQKRRTCMAKETY